MKVSRLAPTASGHLHLGNLMNFVLTWALVRRAQGELWLRMDDADEARARDEYVHSIKETLVWLGLRWDHEAPPQKARRDLYQHYLGQLPHYACDCSRREILERTGSARYDGHCRQQGLVHVPGQTQLRFLAPDASDDVVLWRKEDLPAYQLVSLSEDLEAKVNLIVRGEDLADSTRLQLLMARALGAAGASFVAAEFIHHPLLLDARGHKLSKSKGALSLPQLRAQGLSAGQVYELLCHEARWPETARSAQDFLHLEFPHK